MSDKWKSRRVMWVVGLLITYHFSFITAFAQSSQQWRDSLEVLNKQLRYAPDDIHLRLLKAECNINLQQWQYAIDEYRAVLKRDEGNLAALFFRAYAYEQMRQYAFAKADYEAFLAIQPRHFEARLGLAHIKQKMGRRADTLDELNQLVQLFPDSATAYAARAAYETEQHMTDVALYDWDEAIRLAPTNGGFVVSKVDLLLQEGRADEARTALDAAVKRGVPRYALKEWYDKCR